MMFMPRNDLSNYIHTTATKTRKKKHLRRIVCDDKTNASKVTIYTHQQIQHCEDKSGFLIITTIRARTRNSQELLR